MTKTEMVTDFKLSEVEFETPHGTVPDLFTAEAICVQNDLDPKTCVTSNRVYVKVQTLIDALNAHCLKAGLEFEEYSFSVSPSIRFGDKSDTIPQFFWNLIAFASEGSSEGYYVHVGALIRSTGCKDCPYFDFGFCKVNTADSAYAIAREAQRFLTAARWN